MKFLITLSLVVVCVFILSVVESQQQYVNFQPYQSNGCKGESSGIGYSIALNQCLSYDKNNTYSFSSNGDKVTWIQYGIYNSELTCTTTPVTSQSITTGCLKNSKIAFDSNSLPTLNYYYKVSISNTPLVNPESYIKSFMYDVNVCNDDNDGTGISNLSYLTNGTKAINTSNGGRPESYYCGSNKMPYTYYCSIWGCGPTDTSASCKQLNSTQESFTLIDQKSSFIQDTENNYYSVFCN